VKRAIQPVDDAAAAAGFGLQEVHISGFRTARELSFSPGPLCALVGEADVGKSNVLTAIWTLLDPHAPAPAEEDVAIGHGRSIRIAATLADGEELELDAAPPQPPRRDGAPVPALFLSGAQRAGALVERRGLTASRRGRRSCSSAHSMPALPEGRRRGRQSPSSRHSRPAAEPACAGSCS
jgi:hypothetical protein